VFSSVFPLIFIFFPKLIRYSYQNNRKILQLNPFPITHNNRSTNPFLQIITKISLYKQAYQKNMPEIQAVPKQEAG